MSERGIQQDIRLALGMDVTLFRNNTGSAWMGDVVKLPSGDVLIRNPRPVQFGLVKGGSDLIGWTEKIVTPDMVGKKVPIFTGLEVKTDNGRVTKEQVNFINAVNNAGGFAGVVRSIDQAKKICQLG
jgi:hypothetical protein